MSLLFYPTLRGSSTFNSPLTWLSQAPHRSAATTPVMSAANAVSGFMGSPQMI